MAETTARWTAAEAAAKAAEAEYIDKQIVEEMIESAQLISDGEYSGYCTEDINISSLHTADVVPVVHGRWELEYGTYGKMRCSVCKKEALIEKTIGDVGVITNYVDSNYCPNCGAKMDEKEG